MPRHQLYPAIFVLGALSYFLIFHKMGAHPIRMWDESYFAVHSFEMLQKGSLLVSYFDGVPDLRGSKPPLQNWLQMLAIKLNGLNEVSVRLPSALAAASCVFILFFFLKNTANTLFAWIATLMLLSAQGFISWHTARTGDADTLLALTLLFQFIAFYKILTKAKPLWTWIFSLSILLAFFTKSFAGFFFLPGFAVYLVLFEYKHIKPLLKSPHVYASMLLLIGFILSYYFFRDHLQEGYINYAFRVHAGRFAEVIGPHDHPWNFYVMNLIRERFSWWIAPAVLGIALSVTTTSSFARLLRLASITSLSLLVLLSLSASKLYWYDNPLFPILSVLAAFPIYLIISTQAQFLLGRVAFVSALFVLPLFYMYRQAQSNYPGWAEREFEIKEYYLHKLFVGHADLKNLSVLPSTYIGGLLFYKHAFSQRNQALDILTKEELVEGDVVLVSDDPQKQWISERFRADTVDVLHNALVLNLNSRIHDEPATY